MTNQLGLKLRHLVNVNKTSCGNRREELLNCDKTKPLVSCFEARCYKLQGHPPPHPPHTYFLICSMKGTLLPALALNLGIEHKLCSAAVSNIDCVKFLWMQSWDHSNIFNPMFLSQKPKQACVNY